LEETQYLAIGVELLEFGEFLLETANDTSIEETLLTEELFRAVATVRVHFGIRLSHSNPS
jgi:hypothetical protein